MGQFVSCGSWLFLQPRLVPRKPARYTFLSTNMCGVHTRASPSGKASASQSSEQENANATKATHNQIRPVKTPYFRNGRFFMGSRATGTTRVFSESVPSARRSPRTLTPANTGRARPTPRRARRSPYGCSGRVLRRERPVTQPHPLRQGQAPEPELLRAGRPGVRQELLHQGADRAHRPLHPGRHRDLRPRAGVRLPRHDARRRGHPHRGGAHIQAMRSLSRLGLQAISLSSSLFVYHQLSVPPRAILDSIAQLPAKRSCNPWIRVHIATLSNITRPERCRLRAAR